MKIFTGCLSIMVYYSGGNTCTGSRKTHYKSPQGRSGAPETRRSSKTVIDELRERIRQLEEEVDALKHRDRENVI